MPETGLTFTSGFNPGTKLVRMPESGLKLVRMPGGGLTLVPGLVHWTKPQKLVLVWGRIKWLTNTQMQHFTMALCYCVSVRKYITATCVALFYFEIIRKC